MLCFMGHTLMENRHGLVVQAGPDASGRPRRTPRRHRHDRPPFAGLDAPPHARSPTKASTAPTFVADLRRMCVTPHIARKARHSAVDRRTTRHAGYAASQKRRKKIEEPFGWAKTVGGMAQTTLRGVERVRARFTLTMAACNLARLPRPAGRVTWKTRRPGKGTATPTRYPAAPQTTEPGTTSPRGDLLQRPVRAATVHGKISPPALRRAAAARRDGPRHRSRPGGNSCSTSPCPISTPSCASRCGPRSRSCTACSARRRSTSTTIR